MVWALSTLAQQVLTQSHQAQVRGTATSPAFGTETNLPVTAGSVTCDATSQTRRSATVTIADPALWPANPLDLLSPLGAELLLEYGISLPDGTVEWVPLIQGVLSDATRTLPAPTDGAVTLNLADRSLKVQDDKLEAPGQTVPGATVVAEITRLVHEALPAVSVTDLTGSSTVAATLDIQKERWADGIEKLADSIGAEVFFDAVGNLVVRPQPTLAGTVVWTVRDGRVGVLVQAREKQTRQDVYNKVVAAGNPTSGAAPVYATSTDNDPTSPTYYGGALGHKPRFYTSQLLTTVPQCQATADALLARVTGMQAQVSLQAVCNPALEAGDVILTSYQGTQALHIIDKVTVPLKPGDAQQIDTRSKALPPEQG